MTKVIYVLEDDPDMARIYQREICAAGYEVETFTTISDFVARVTQAPPCLSVLDLELPDGNALSVLRNVLAERQHPAIVASGRSGLGDKLTALDSGADDYIVKPFEPLELVARIQTVLRRLSTHDPAARATSGRRACFAGLRVDLDSYEMTSPDGTVTHLSHEDVKLLSVLISARGRVLSRDYLLAALKAEEEDVFDRSIDVRVSRLRKKLHSAAGNTKLIRTVYGAGYVFALPVEYLD